jgi:hypothetical protein
MTVAHILREFSEDENFYYIVRELIIKSDGDPEIIAKNLQVLNHCLCQLCPSFIFLATLSTIL